ncbi:response regulator [Guyparkeria sp.]|uniref:response regulator n=1 Tax=Guyparkeria sp. TaxID=2035736 RepID=UPI0039710DA5
MDHQTTRSETSVPPSFPRSERPSEESQSRHAEHHAWVLVVDDNETERSEMVELISQMGHFSWMADSLAESEWRIRHDPDLKAVVLDIGLPDGNGLKLLDSLRSSAGRLEERNIIVVTGLTPAEYPAKEMFGDVRAVLRKPIEADRLKSTLDEILIPSSTHE